MEVNWRECTAQLYPLGIEPDARYIPLRFPAALGAEMLRHATRFVMLAGRARYAENDDCTLFAVEEVIPSRGSKPFSREEFEEALAKAKPVRAADMRPMQIPPEEMQEFIRVILESRDAS